MKKIVSAIVFVLLFLVMIFLVKTVDVAQVGPKGTWIGLSHVNAAFHEATGVNMIFYSITDMLGMVALLVVAAFAVTGLLQLIKRKSFFKVDREIYALGGLYAVTLVLYALFEKVIINYRPVIMPGCDAPEASFPSSHTMLTCVVMISTIMIIERFVSRPNARILKWIAAIIMAETVIGRLVCGVHWFTDIVGGLLISAALLCAFSGVIDAIDYSKSAKVDE